MYNTGISLHSFSVAEPVEPKLWTKSEPKINNFGSATLHSFWTVFVAIKRRFCVFLGKSGDMVSDPNNKNESRADNTY